MNRPRVVLDTNCYVSALALGGRLTRLRAAWRKRLFVPVACYEAIEELARVFVRKRKLKIEPKAAHAFLYEIFLYAERFSISDPHAPVPGLRDPKDFVFVNLAREAEADFLVSGDKDLLALRESVRDVRIIPPGEFLEMVERPE